ncbi:MAG: sigma-54 dependent transcriptional regulator [Algisphaera sp.]
MSTKILVVDDKQMMRDSVAATLQRAGFVVVVANGGEAALPLIARHKPAVVVTDLKMPGMDGLALLSHLAEADPDLPVVLMTAYGSINDAVSAMKSGAFDFVQKPFEGDQLVMVVKRAVKHRQQVKASAAPRPMVVSSTGHAVAAPVSAVESPALVGDSSAMQAIGQQIEQIAQSDHTVLIQGASGTGKEVVARTLHARSPRAGQVMLCLNCAALSSALLESELFGHEKGAFTGADNLRKGRFELADGGTLLLDEISEIGPGLQAKLLRVLQEGQFERVGSSATRQVDVRVIATTNRDLTRSVADGSFRQDLYYRLNVLPLVLPPLCDRAGDVAMLAGYFLKQASTRSGGGAKVFDRDALAVLTAYHWPGNVRELQNICERASVLASSETITAGLIQPWLLTLPSQRSRTGAMGSAIPAPAELSDVTTPYAALTPAADAGSPVLQAPEQGAMSASTVGHASVAVLSEVPTAVLNGAPAAIKPLEEMQREQIVQTLERFNGNRTHTAKALGIGVRTLGLKIKKWKEMNLVSATL